MVQDVWLRSWVAEEVDSNLKDTIENYFQDYLETAKEYFESTQCENPGLAAGNNIARPLRAMRAPVELLVSGLICEMVEESMRVKCGYNTNEEGESTDRRCLCIVPRTT